MRLAAEPYGRRMRDSEAEDLTPMDPYLDCRAVSDRELEWPSQPIPRLERRYRFAELILRGYRR
jgi:hypothetical protein